MRGNDFDLTKQQIAREVFEENDDIDERYRRYQDSTSLTVTIGNGITNPSLSEDQLREQLKRCLEVEHNPIIGVQHFSEASYECVRS